VATPKIPKVRREPQPRITKVRHPRFMAEWTERKSLEGAGELVRIGGSWFSVPRDGETVQLANLSIVRADRVLVGNEELAWAWGYEAKKKAEDGKRYRETKRSAEDRVREITRLGLAHRIPRENPVGSGRASVAKNAQPVMPADYAMQLYQAFVVERKVRSPHTPTTGGIPGTRNWNQRAKFDVEFDEKLLSEHERESEQAVLDYERYVTGDYKDEDGE